jgi:hypothetical protein
MKRIVLAAAILATSVSVGAAETVEDKIACMKQEWFDEFVKFSAADDMASVQAYLDSRKCLQMKGGLKVTVIEYPGTLSGQWLVAHKGQKFVAQREGIKLGD